MKQIEQYVMAYGVEQDRLRAILPAGYTSLRPVLRINGEIIDGKKSYLEFNTAVEKDGMKGWLNIGVWENITVERWDKTVRFATENLSVTFTGTGVEGSCPAEKDNDGCWFGERRRLPETITSKKEFCDCSFRWDFDGNGAFGISEGKTLPAIPTEVGTVYPKEAFTVQNAACIPCLQVLGAYTVTFGRESYRFADGCGKGQMPGMTKREREVTDREEILAILEKAKVVHVGMVDGDEPYVVPMNYGYTMEEDGRLTLYLHGAQHGRKLDILRKNPRVFAELVCDTVPFDGDVACRYGMAYSSLMARGRAVILEDPAEKADALTVLMKTQTGGDFSFTEKLVKVVSVIRIDIDGYTAKKRPLPGGRE